MEAKKLIGIRKLNNLYGPYAVRVLFAQAYIAESRDRKRGAPRSFLITSKLPDRDKFNAIRDKIFTRTLEELVGSAYGEFECLRDELQEWYDNLPDSFRDGDKGSELQEAIDLLAVADNQPDFSGNMAKLMQDTTIVVLPMLDTDSRPRRLSAAVRELEEVKAKLEESQEEPESAFAKYVKKVDLEDDVKELIDQIDNDLMEAENVSFPGMY